MTCCEDPHCNPLSTAGNVRFGALHLFLKAGTGRQNFLWTIFTYQVVKPFFFRFDDKFVLKCQVRLHVEHHTSGSAVQSSAWS